MKSTKMSSVSGVKYTSATHFGLHYEDEGNINSTKDWDYPVGMRPLGLPGGCKLFKGKERLLNQIPTPLTSVWEYNHLPILVLVCFAARELIDAFQEINAD